MDADLARLLAIAIAFAVVSLVLAVLALPALTAVGRQHWRGASIVHVGTRAALAAGVPGLVVASGVVHVVGLPETSAVAAAASLGGAVFLGGMALRYAPMRQLRALVPRLAADSTRAAAAAEVERLIDRSRPSAQSGQWLTTWVSAVLSAAEHLANAGEFEAAARVLDRLSGLRLTGVLAALQDALVVMVRLHLGRRDLAEHALASVPRPVATPMIESMLIALDTLMRALDGRHDDARRSLAKWSYPAEWHVRTRLEARLHAEVASGDEAAGQTALLELERRLGARGLEAAARLEGPASARTRARIRRSTTSM